jgi:hypothetical protein
MTIYFIGCDIGGWHTTNGDAFAACRFSSGEFTLLDDECGSGNLYYPVDRQGIFAKILNRACAEKARIVIAIDAALAWPVEFVKLVRCAPLGGHLPTFTRSRAIDNPCLYRETERFIRRNIRRDRDPFTAPGDKFGNNSSKAQSLVAWITGTLPEVYRPPFDPWDEDRAKNARYSVIEVYPAASMESHLFQNLEWPFSAQQMRKIGDSDVADAKLCAMTAVCYAATVKMDQRLNSQLYPRIFVPPSDNTYDLNMVAQEGWIFAPEPDNQEQSQHDRRSSGRQLSR